MMISFTVFGEPVPQPRLAQGWKNGKRVAYVRKLRGATHPVIAYKAAVGLTALTSCSKPFPLGTPLSVDLTFYLPRPQRLIWKRKPMPAEWCPTLPDCDNLIKSVADALTGIVWEDDGCIAELHCRKMYVAGGESPRTEVVVTELARESCKILSAPCD